MKAKNIILLGVAALSLAACSRIEPGQVGVRVNNYGSNAGVEQHALPVGTYFAGPGVDIYSYPVSTKTYVWTKSEQEGKKINEEITFQDKNGMAITADVGVSYHVDATKAPGLFTRYHTDVDGIVAGPLRLAVRNALINQAAAMDVEELYGQGKNRLITSAMQQVQHQFEPLGLDVEQLYWADLRYPESVIQQINARKTNEQQALAAQAKVATAKAEADAEVAKANGRAQATRIEAEAIRANPQILQQRAIEKWSGNLPTYYVAGNSNGIMMGIPIPTK